MASKMKLLSDDEEDESAPVFTINKSYAEKYDTWRRKEELQKFKDRYGKDALEDGDEESSSSSSEDDENEDTSEVFDKEFYHTLSCLKSKDPKIYDKNATFFENLDHPKTPPKKNSVPKSKPMFLKDYERKIILDGGLLPDEDENPEEIEKAMCRSPSYYEEQEAIKESFRKVIECEEEEDDAIGGLFSMKVKTNEEQTKEEDEYASWLLGSKKQLEDQEEEQKLSHLRSYWNNPTLDPGEKFLRDYILKKKFSERGKNCNAGWRVEEIEEEVECGNDEMVDGALLEQQEGEIEKMEEFEHKFNFRFEEPDQEFIKRYPRTLESSLRKKDDKRKQKREVVRTRKETEKEKRKEMLNKAKELKQKEIEARLKQLCSITGNEDIGFKGDDLDEDFDPEKHDQRMSQLFGDDTYYANPEKEKPVFPSVDDELDLEDWDNWGVNDDAASGAQDENLYSEDPNFNMDCEYDPKASFQREILMASQKRPKGVRGKGRRWRARESRLGKALLTKKPTFDPMAILSKAKLQEGDTTAAFEKYVDEYYGLDYEDIIGGDLPCRFKYRKVMPNDFGLSVEEILNADDKELNRWCSLKKAVQIRPEENEKYDLQAYRKKGSNYNLKKKIFRSLYSNPEESDSEINESKGPKSKSKGTGDSKLFSVNGVGEGDNVEMKGGDGKDAPKFEEHSEQSVDKKVKKKRKRNRVSKVRSIAVERESDVGPAKEDNLCKVGRVSKETSIAMQRESDVGHAKERENLSQVGGGSWDVKGKGGGEEEKKGKKRNEKPSKKKKDEIGVKRPKFKKQRNAESYLSGLTKSRLKAYGINPKRFENKLKYKKAV